MNIFELIYETDECYYTVHLSLNKQILNDFITKVREYDKLLYTDLSFEGCNDEEWEDVKEKREEWCLNHPLVLSDIEYDFGSIDDVDDYTSKTHAQFLIIKEHELYEGEK